MKDPKQLTLLFEKHLAGNCSVEETQRLMDYFQTGEDQEVLTEMVTTALDMEDDHHQHNPLIAGVVAKVDVDLFKQIKDNQISRPSKGVVKLWLRMAIAAAVALIVLGVYFFNAPHHKEPASGSHYVNDIAPGKTGATLTLSNGKTIKLSDASKGELAKEAGISISKTANGQIVYQIKENTKDPHKINTLTTAKGETYMLTLPDQSKVWMNAASSLTYSATLAENGQRKVKLEGEAYFEISKDKAHPFIVSTKNQDVVVLGTHFNVNAYSDDPSAKTTLLEGSVKLLAMSNDGAQRAGQSSALNLPPATSPPYLKEGWSKTGVVLKPNQQSTLKSGAFQIKTVNPQLAIAWKNNEFMFQGESIQYIMKMVERWYNVQVIYQGEVPTEKYLGGVSRFDNVSKVLQALEFSGGVHFKVEGRKIYVSK